MKPCFSFRVPGFRMIITLKIENTTVLIIKIVTNIEHVCAKHCAMHFTRTIQSSQ